MRIPGWYDACIWLAFTVIGFVGPVAVGVFVRTALGGDFGIDWVAGQGQFAVSSAGLLMTTAYFVARPGSFSRLPLTEWFMLSSVVGLVAGIALFILPTLTLAKTPTAPIFYEVPSIILFLLALALAFIAVGLDRTREITESDFLKRNQSADRAKIDDAFDSTF